MLSEPALVEALKHAARLDRKNELRISAEPEMLHRMLASPGSFLP
jgi:hypothetical protein